MELLEEKHDEAFLYQRMVVDQPTLARHAFDAVIEVVAGMAIMSIAFGIHIGLHFGFGSVVFQVYCFSAFACAIKARIMYVDLVVARRALQRRSFYEALDKEENVAMRQDRVKVEAGAAVTRVALAEADWTDADTAAAAAVAANAAANRNAAAEAAAANAAMGSPARSLSRDSLVDDHSLVNGTTTPPPGADAFAFAIDQADSAATLNGMLLSHLSSKSMSPPDSPERSLVRSWGPGPGGEVSENAEDPRKDKGV